MSNRNILEDQRMSFPGSSTKDYGRYFSLVSSGTNQDRTKPLEPHPYTLTLVDYYHAAYYRKQCWDGVITGWAAAIVGTAQVRAWTSADDYRLYGKLEEAYDKGGFNAGVFAGELGETVDMLAGRTKQLAKAAMAAKKGRFAQAASILGVGGHNKVSPSTGKRHRDDAGPQHPQRISDGWLELMYGWLPLCSDIYDLADQIARADKPRSKRIHARHSIGLKATSASPSLFEAKGGGRRSKQIVAYITEDIPSWSQALGLEDPEIVAWELVPFSFVADWFLPVGGWLQARAFAQRAKGTFVITDVYKGHARLGKFLVKPCSGTVYATFGYYPQSIGWRRDVTVTRTVTTSLPQVPLPSFGNGLGKGWRLANAAALLAGIFSGR